MLAGVEIYFWLRLNSDLQGTESYAVVRTKVEKICLPGLYQGVAHIRR